MRPATPVFLAAMALVAISPLSIARTITVTGGVVAPGTLEFADDQAPPLLSEVIKATSGMRHGSYPFAWILSSTAPDAATPRPECTAIRIAIQEMTEANLTAAMSINVVPANRPSREQFRLPDAAATHVYIPHRRGEIILRPLRSESAYAVAWEPGYSGIDPTFTQLNQTAGIRHSALSITPWGAVLPFEQALLPELGLPPDSILVQMPNDDAVSACRVSDETN